ncbi:uncharacterized protein DMENIID0001_112980 [Sergentomyia squamirostris]
MALNIALPLSVGEFMDPLDILSPDQIMGLDSRDRDQIKMLISPISSESSGVSSMASDEIKKSPEKYTYEDCKVMYGGRNILDMGSNLTNGSFKIRYTVLPENDYSMFLKNRSQYHRLGAQGHIQEYNLIRCSCCGLMIPDQPELDVPISGPNSISRAIIAAAQVKIGSTATNPKPYNDSRIYYNNYTSNHMNNNHNNGGGGIAIGHNNNGLRNASYMYRQQHQQIYGQNFNANNTNNFKYYNNNCPAIM